MTHILAIVLAIAPIAVAQTGGRRGNLKPADTPQKPAQPAQPGGSAEPGASSSPAPSGEPDAAARIDDILTKLEKRSDGLKDIKTGVVFVDQDDINMSKNTKKGRIMFWMTEPNAHFMIHFDRTEMDGVLGKQEWYLFDGQWLHQGVERIKTVTKQEIAKPGEKVDLFDLEKTPFPLPFGQKKDQIGRNFDVTLLPGDRADPVDTDHLMLVPKSSSRMFRKYDRVDLYVSRTVHLPTRIVVMKNSGRETSTAEFPDLSTSSINTGVGPADFAKPKAWDGYQEVTEELVPGE